METAEGAPVTNGPSTTYADGNLIIAFAIGSTPGVPVTVESLIGQWSAVVQVGIPPFAVNFVAASKTPVSPVAVCVAFVSSHPVTAKMTEKLPVLMSLLIVVAALFPATVRRIGTMFSPNEL